MQEVLKENMKEHKNIIDQYKIFRKNPTIQMALATVVRVEGSSYRRTGARMLVCEDGNWIGGISGGCLEGDALKRAKMAILKNSPSLITYDTTQADDHQIGVGLGCNGIIDVLFVPIDFKDPNHPLILLENALKFDSEFNLLITVCKSPAQTNLLGKIISYKSENDLGIFQDILDIELIKNEIAKLEKSKNLFFENGMQLFIEKIPKPVHVYLMGNQYDVYPLAKLLTELAFDLSIVAEPLKIKTPEKYTIIPPSEFDSKYLNKQSAVVLMSHSYETDKKNLSLVLNSDVAYIGMLGPKVRSEKIFDELALNKIDDRIFAPVGLDIGANTPEEIAFSIVAEIKSFFAERQGGFLRNRKKPINERDEAMYFK
jgi:xanthine dehydrogenase accessory factor